MSELNASVPCLSVIDAASRDLDARLVVLARTNVTLEHANLAHKIGRGISVNLPHLDGDAVLGVHLPDDETPLSWSDSLILEGAFGSIEFAQGARLMRALTGVDLSGESDATNERWEWLQAALVGRLGDTPFAGADRLARITGTKVPAAAVLRLSLRSGHHAFDAYARASAAAWLNLLGHTIWTREQCPVSEVLHLSFEVVLQVARHTLPAGVLRTLAAGDIILPSNPMFKCNGEGTVRIGSLIARVRYQSPCTLEILSKEGQLESEEELVHNAEQPVMAGAGEGKITPAEDRGDVAALDALPVMLEFELGRTRMSLGEMRTLGAGSIIPFAGGTPASIAIVSAGRVIGRGEVVGIEDQLGIRVTQWGTP